MIENIISTMSSKIDGLKNSINQDIADIKEAQHDDLLKRNDLKQKLIDEITQLKLDLNKALITSIEAGEDVNIYRSSVDALENNIKELYELNKKLSAIVIPIQHLYQEMVAEISDANGGRIFDIKA